jgi:hypothetical protein
MVDREEDQDEPIELDIDPDKVCFIIIKAREFDGKVEPVEPDPGSNPADDDEREVLEDYGDDPTMEELHAVIDALNEDEIIDLVALVWVGRGDFARATWSEARRLAAERHKRRSARYLLGIPLLGDYLEEGLSALGYSCADVEMGRL